MNDAPKDILNADALGLEELPIEDQEDAVLAIGDLAFKEALMRLVERMDGASKEEFSALLAKDASEEEIAAFIDARVPDADQVIESAVAEISGDILSGNLPA